MPLIATLVGLAAEYANEHSFQTVNRPNQPGKTGFSYQMTEYANEPLTMPIKRAN